MDNKKITIVGLGLIGGSLAKAFRRTNHDFTIIGMDTDRENLKRAKQEGTVDFISDNLEQAASDSHFIFLCTPINRIPDMLRTLRSVVRPGTIITDVGSIKSGIMEEAEQILPRDIYFIGGHPMAGGERSGYSAGVAHLFENAYYILTPRESTPESVLEEMKHLISSTGAIPLILDPLTHDKMVGAVSHLPHIVAAALVNTVQQAESSEGFIQRLAAGGFKDITRIASSNPKMWRDICLSNKKQLLPLIMDIINSLNSFKQDLEGNNDLAVEAFYQAARDFRKKIPSSESLYLLPYYQIYVDVEDKPGNIGQVATILGSHNVNIKNIRIINSREDEPGCLVLSLDDQEAQEKAVAVLKQTGWDAYTRD